MAGTQKASGIKIPAFDKENYNIWKRKILLFIKGANPLFMGILENGPFIPQKEIPAATVDGVLVPAHWVPKKPSDYLEPEKEKVALDDHLQLILLDSLTLDKAMCGNVIGCSSAKEMWNKIELLCEGSEEVRENQRQILVSQYEAFMAKPGEELTLMFERYSKLLAELQIHGKFYEKKEVNIKFLLTLPEHLEHRVTAIREGRDLNTVSLETLYGVLKSYELELFQKRAIQSGSKGRMANMSGALVAQDPRISEPPQLTQQNQVSYLKIEEVDNDDEDKVVLELKDVEDEDFYTIEEMESMDNPTMAYMAKRFKNFRFRRNKPFKPQGQSSRFNKGSTSKAAGGTSKGGYKSGLMDKSKFRCYNCNELGHFANDCRKPKQFQRIDKGSGNQLKKNQGKAYVAEGRCWDESDNEEEEEYVNLALMARSDDEASTSSNQVPSLVLLDMSTAEYKQTIEELTAEMFNVHTSLSAANEEIARLTILNEALNSEKEILLSKTNPLDSLELENAKLKNDLICAKEIEAFLRKEISANEFKLKAFSNASRIIQGFPEGHTNIKESRVGIGYEYGRRPGKEAVSNDCSESAAVKPHVLKKVSKPIFKIAEKEFDESLLLIKQELLDEDEKLDSTLEEGKDTVKSPVTVTLPTNQTARSEEAVNKGVTETSKDTVKSVPKTAPLKHTVETVVVKGTVKGNSTATSEHAVNTKAPRPRNRNGKVGVNKKNDYAYVQSAPRKLCNKCGSSQHLTHVCKKPSEVKPFVTEVNGNLHRTPIMQRTLNVCNNIDCMPCKITTMSTCFNLPILSSEKCAYMETTQTSKPTGISKAAPTKKKTKSYSKQQWMATGVTKFVPSMSTIVINDEETPTEINPAGPNKDWVPDAN
jgi:gag-polypeptide of LTR copia-type/Zinc knuckle